MHASRIFSNCLIWFAALLSPLQGMQGMSLFCSNCAVCTVERDTADEPLGHDCHCKAKTDRDEKPAAAMVVRCKPLAPCSCPPSCWCHRPVQPQLSCQQNIELGGSFDLLRQAIDTPAVALGLEQQYPFEVDAVKIPTAQQVCAKFCRFLA